MLGDIRDDEILHDGEEDIVSLFSPDGERLDFVQIAGVAHKGGYYAILQPVEEIEGIGEDEALVFEVTNDENDEMRFTIVLDDEIINAVFETYNKMLDNIENDEGQE